jgi:hypothetical protein
MGCKEIWVVTGIVKSEKWSQKNEKGILFLAAVQTLLLSWRLWEDPLPRRTRRKFCHRTTREIDLERGGIFAGVERVEENSEP